MHSGMCNNAPIITRECLCKCICPDHADIPYRALTPIILETWQRQYDYRPYKNFIIHGKLFEEKLKRRPDLNDCWIIRDFLRKTKQLENCELAHFILPSHSSLSASLVEHLLRMRFVSMLNVSLPDAFLRTLRNKADQSKIKFLRLACNELWEDYAEYLQEFLEINTELEHLDVGWCSLDPTTAAIIAHGVHKSPSLRSLDMSRILPFYSVPNPSVIVHLIAILLRQCRLEEVHFQHCEIDGLHIEPICEYLADKTIHLIYLDLASNNIGPDGIKLLLESIACSKKLIGLNVACNKLGKQGGEWISRLLPSTNLRFLDIAHNEIPACAMTDILLMMKKRHPIQILNIHNNCFSLEVGKILRRQIDAGVVLLDSMDVEVTYDEDTNGFRVIPQPNTRCETNYRWNRVYPFHRTLDVFKTFKWGNSERDQCGQPTKIHIKVEAKFIDPVVVDKFGNILEITKQGWVDEKLVGAANIFG